MKKAAWATRFLASPLWFLGLLLFTLILRTPLLVHAPPIGDTLVSSGAPKANYGSLFALAVRQGTTTYIQFNLGTVPAGATVIPRSWASADRDSSICVSQFAREFRC
jgi:hypothetical protein